MSDLALTLQQFLEAAAAAPAVDSTGRLLAAMQPNAARILRLSAIPHQFDAALLQILLPTLARAEADGRCQELARLSIVTPVNGAFAIHDQSRHAILSDWLRPENRRDFAEASARLAAHFGELADSATGAELETLQRQLMYHRLGANPNDGFAQFEALCRHARAQLRYSECAALVRLVHDFDPILSAEQRLWLAYHEGKLALDLREWEAAERLFRTILDAESGPRRLRGFTLVRLGQVAAEQRDWTAAISALDEAYRLARGSPDDKDLLPRVAYELGAAHLGDGDLVQAERFLRVAARRAKEQEAWPILATAYNGIGNVQLKRRDSGAAIKAFDAALDSLARSDEVFRSAQVYNNLGLAYAEQGDWKRSAECFERSLEIRRKAGDSFGQALALANLARVCANEGKVEQAVAHTEQAIAIFDDVRALPDGAVARQNLGKYHRRLGRTDDARRAFTEAHERFAKLGLTNDADAVAADLERMTKKIALPWWAWIAVGVLGLLLLALLVR